MRAVIVLVLAILAAWAVSYLTGYGILIKQTNGGPNPYRPPGETMLWCSYLHATGVAMRLHTTIAPERFPCPVFATRTPQ